MSGYREDDKPRAWGRYGYIREGLEDAAWGAGRGVMYALIILLVLAVGLWILRELWVAYNCTTVLGTQVCR